MNTNADHSYHTNGAHGRNGQSLGDPSLDRFAEELHANLPRLSDEAMARVEARMRAELDAVYPAVESGARPSRAVLFTFGQFMSAAAMLALVFIFASYVSSPSPVSPPTDPRLADAQPPVVDEMRVYIEPEASDAGVSPYDAAWITVDRSESLIGIDRYARRD